MNRTIHQALAFVIAVILSGEFSRAADNQNDAASSLPVIQLFDGGWNFNLGDILNAQATDLDDSGWRQINLPHDWSIEQPFDQKFASGTAFLPGGVGWYRKHFAAPILAAGQHVNIIFDGVYKDAEVWINGHSMGRRPSGFIGYDYDLTPFLSADGKPNTLAVRVDHSDYADSRFYTGSGIYRHVWLQVKNSVHLVRWGTFITTPQVSKQSANVKIETRVVNNGPDSRDVTLLSTILDGQGNALASLESSQKVEPGKEYRFEHNIRIPNPAVWSVEAPNLYKVVSRLKSGSAVLDEDTSPFGMRELVFNPQKGFFLNGVKTVFKGVCVHQDEGSFGAAVPFDAMKRRLALLKELGCNAIRASHNPPAPEFLDLCDQMGFLVMDEAFDEWARPKKKWVEGWNAGQPSFEGYAKFFKDWSIRDLQDIVRRDRNHPSVVLWSIGNEIDYERDPYYDPTLPGYTPDLPSAAELTGIARTLSKAVKEIDQTRPVTAALAHIETSNKTGLADALDVVGYNYQEKFYAQDHAAYPARSIIGSENWHTYEAWKSVLDMPYANGQFIWTGFDYLGEARGWPLRGSNAGVLDECGFKKPAFYFRQSLWSDKPVLFLAVAPLTALPEQGRPRGRLVVANWTWPGNEGKPISIYCNTNCEKVDLFLNGKSLGAQLLSSSADHVPSWSVPFAPGTLKAVGMNAGAEVCSFELKTTGSAQAIKLKPESKLITADGQSLCFVEADVVDSQANPVFAADNQITFQIQGPGKIVGLDSGNLRSHEDFKSNARHVFQGKCLVIIQSTNEAGPIVLRASGAGLAGGEVSITSSR